MYFSELILYERAPSPFSISTTKSHNPRTPIRKLTHQKGQIQSHLKNQKIGFCIDFLKQKTKLALKDSRHSNRKKSLTRRQLLASRMKLDLTDIKLEESISFSRGQKQRDRDSERVGGVSTINIGDMAEMPLQIPKQKGNRFLMSLTARDRVRDGQKQGRFLNRTSRLQSFGFKIDRRTNNSSRLSANYENYSTISVLENNNKTNQGRNLQTNQRRRKRKGSNVSAGYEFECYKL